MEAGSLCLPASSKKVFTNSGRSLCNKDQHAAGTVYLLETRPFWNGSGRIDDSLDKSPRLHLPVPLPLGEVSAEDYQQAAAIMLITPVWVHQPWYPAVLDAIVEIPVLLPLSDSLLLDPFNQPHHLVLSHALHLTAWMVSGKDSLQQEFWNRLLASSLQAGARVPTLHTNLPGPDGSAEGSGSLFSICDRLRQLLGQPLQRGSSGLQYRSNNTIRSAVSMTHSHVSGSPIGLHALVIWLMKGIYNSRPPVPPPPPPYTST